MKSVSGLKLARSIEGVCGNLKNVTRQRDGSVLLEANTDRQIEAISSVKSLAGLQVKVEPHPTLNLCKGVVTHEDFVSESETDIKSFFEPEGVVHIHRVQRKVEGKLIPTSTLILTFDRPCLPNHIKCGFYNLRVRQYIPNPLRCFKCQKFGHTQDRCKSPSVICVSCGHEAHESECQFPPCCVNCHGNHASNSRDCPSFKSEKEIQKIRVTEKVSFPEARRRFQEQNPVTFSRTFTQVVSAPSPKLAIGQTQTTFGEPVSRQPSRSVSSQINLRLMSFTLESLERDPSLKIIIPTKYQAAEVSVVDSAVHDHSPSESQVTPEPISSSLVPVSDYPRGNPHRKTSPSSGPPSSSAKSRPGRSKSRSPIHHHHVKDKHLTDIIVDTCTADYPAGDRDLTEVLNKRKKKDRPSKK